MKEKYRKNQMIFQRLFCIARHIFDAFEVSRDFLVGASEKQILKEMLNRIEEVDKMNRARELPFINAKCFCCGEFCLTTLLK